MRHLASGFKLTHVGVDWLSCSANDRVGAAHLWEVGERLLNRAKLEGERPTRWHGHGYDGYRAGGISVGSRKDSTLVRLSGKEACYEWEHAVSAADNVSRLDLAVDVQFERPVSALAVQLYRDSGHVSSRGGRPRTRTLVICSDGGQTCYLGRRVSDAMGRLYDKGVESATAPAGTLWRYEVEYKRGPALFAAQTLSRAESVEGAISSTVASWFGARGGRVWGFSPELALIQWSRSPTSDANRLSWLARCVRPTVVALTETEGYYRVSTALGWPQLYQGPLQSAVQTPVQED